MATRRTAMHCNLGVMCKINNLQEVEAEYINKERRQSGGRGGKEEEMGLAVWCCGCRNAVM